MPEEKLKTNEEPTVDVPTEGDPVDIELKDDKKPIETESGEQIKVQEQSDKVELEEYSGKVKTRINKLTGKLRETERREQYSFDYAKRVAE